ncbi:MAG: DUF2231 domain-containing protein, partial [Gammaproteobacteria bacterium]|nr:DUF2231 domain-containing protein [Gammaproteobacteria bacterium]
MIEIVPNWHPLFVHFTVTLLAIAGVLQLILWLTREKAGWTLLVAAQKWLILISSVAVIATVATGLYAYYTVDHDTPSHVAMTDHRNWAFVTAAVFLIGAALFRFRPAWRQSVSGSCFVLALLLVTVTGFKGGELVYRHGLGVMSLPEVSGEGHDHDHGGGGHDNGESKNEHDEEGHDHDTNPKQGAARPRDDGEPSSSHQDEQEHAHPQVDEQEHAHPPADEKTDSAPAGGHSHAAGHEHDAPGGEAAQAMYSGLDSDAARVVEQFHASL